MNPTAKITPEVTPDSTPGRRINPSPAPTGQHAKILNAIDPPAGLEEPDLTTNAITVLERRYLKKDPESGEVTESPRQLLWRVASHVAKAEMIYAPERPDRAVSVAEEFYGIMARREFLPNSPCLMNAGREMGMLSACFVIPVEDSIEGIFEAIKATALIQKAGGGTGFSFSRLRPQGDRVLSSGGTTEGPMSFMQVFSKATDAIQQGAFRRGANMGMLRIDHPDINAFIEVKDDRSKLQNYNLSVAVTDKFCDQVKNDRGAIHEVCNPRSGKVEKLAKRDDKGAPTGEFWTVGEMWDRIIEHAHESGEPGVIFIDRINKQNPIKNVGEIEATNPCGEQPLHPYDSCNLGSINLGILVKECDGEQTFDWDHFKAIIHTGTRFLDNVIDVNKYPLRAIDNMSKTTRRIGLGVMGFADAMYKLGIAYNSEEGLAFGSEVMRVLNDESHLASEVLGEERGVFPAWEGSEWETDGRRVRNSYTTTVAPTGTISILANCSGGIEPMFSLAFDRQVMKDTSGKPTIMREVNYVFEQQAEAAGLYSAELVEQAITDGTIQYVEGLPEGFKRVFVTAHDISPLWHIRMQAAFQRHCDASISKTINFPSDATVEDVREIYELAIDEGVKGITVYRDGCRELQPMALKSSTAKGSEAAPKLDETALLSKQEADGGAVLTPVSLPEIMSCLRIRQMTPFGNMHVKVSVEPHSGREREVFAQLGKGGDVANSDLEAICRILSLWLRSNGSLDMAVKQLADIGSSMTVPTKDGRIMSLADGLARALRRYMEAKAENGLKSLLLGGAANEGDEGDQTKAAAPAPSPATPPATTRPRNVSRYKMKCPSCAANLAFEEGCVKCYGCGFSQC